MANYTSTFMPPIPEVSRQHVSCAEGIQVAPDLILFFGGSTTTTITADSLIRALGDFNNNNGVYGNTDVIGNKYDLHIRWSTDDYSHHGDDGWFVRTNLKSRLAA